jgi:predicted amidophosphoribosyltransferase
VVRRTLSAMANGLLDLLLPASCAGCGAAGTPCCADCRRTWSAPFPVARGTTAGVVAVYALAPYRGVARRMVLAYKERGRRDLAATLGELLAEAVPALPQARPDRDGTWWLVPVPSRPVAARLRGGPHMRRVAESCARRLAATGQPAAVAPALALKRGVRDAVGLDRAQRVANLSGRLVVDSSRTPPGAPVVLLDDVVTTGATAVECTRALGRAGSEVTAVLALTAAG